jgi:signal transduction histidine kinase
VILEVTDNGVGFDATRAVEGHGLRNMRERAFSVGGQLHVDTAPGRGSRLRFEVPVRSEVAP